MVDVIPLRDLDKRFPTPRQPSDVLMTYPLGSLSHDEIFLSLTDQRSELWQHREDWKGHMRLLAANDWVFKTSEWHCSGDLTSAQQQIDRLKEQGHKINVWHPKKYWFIVRHDRNFWACNATPRLMTLPDIRTSYSPFAKLHYVELQARRGWLLLGTVVRFGLMLDTKEDNYAVDQSDGRLYYIDDELYGVREWWELIRNVQ